MFILLIFIISKINILSRDAEHFVAIFLPRRPGSVRLELFTQLRAACVECQQVRLG